ncbi:catabolite repressor/activator [Marinobacter halodurans]|uniref:Catabolite repressor/activator n=1 Tax=Marinobacter halodurans TaxID=2528979 RepID=A0ABY1ZJR3_9GAMM|nr:catabolite repressor/activator [Marinobacter halodurans]TBW49821.1 catabolite repressor/activator [Marinobacter halodurans]
MTLAELARLAGVSRTTASYVLNGRAAVNRIKPETVERVTTLAREHGFRIDAQAAALRGGQSRTLGFILPDLENASYARLAKLLEVGSRAEGYQLLIAGSDDDAETERSLALSFRARRCDALIVASCLPPDSTFYRDLQAEGLPVIAVDRAQDPAQLTCIVSDNQAGAAALTRSVLGPGVHSVVWLDALPELAMTRQRRQGFEEAVADWSGEAIVMSGDRFDRASGAALARELLAERGQPDALVTASYSLLQGVLDVLLERPAGLPADLHLATFGDDRLLDFLPIRVNALPQQHEAIAAATLKAALSAIGGVTSPGCQVIERRLHRRAV